MNENMIVITRNGTYPWFNEMKNLIFRTIRGVIFPYTIIVTYIFTYNKVPFVNKTSNTSVSFLVEVLDMLKCFNLKNSYTADNIHGNWQRCNLIF